MLKIKQMCDPAHFVMMLSIFNVFLQIYRAPGFTSEVVWLILTTLLGNVFIAVNLDMMCKSGYTNFAWLLVLMSVFMMVGADRALASTFSTTWNHTKADGRGGGGGGISAYNT